MKAIVIHAPELVPLGERHNTLNQEGVNLKMSVADKQCAHMRLALDLADAGNFAGCHRQLQIAFAEYERDKKQLEIITAEMQRIDQQIQAALMEKAAPAIAQMRESEVPGEDVPPAVEPEPAPTIVPVRSDGKVH